MFPPRHRAGTRPTSARSAHFAPLAPGLARLLPGLGLSILAAAISWGVHVLLPAVSALVVAIVLGVVAANAARLPAATAAGIAFSAKRLLRAGIVFLGLQLVLSDILDLGAPMLLVVVGIVAGGLGGTIVLGRMLRVRPGLTLLIGCGFSICGAAAVAGAAGVTDPDGEAEEDTITAVALVVIFGTLMIPLAPLLAGLVGLDAHTAGLWTGGSVHEIAQVVAAGGIIGTGALTVAVIVKLARVLLLAPVVAALSIRQRRLARAGAAPDTPTASAKLPPIVPLFVVGFIAMVLARSFLPLPGVALSTGNLLQTGLLSAAMFGLGCGVKIRALAEVGPRPFALAGLSTLLVAAIAGTGIMLVG